MKKKFAVAVMAVAMMMLCGCCLKHEWQPATCVAPETCAKCGKTRGELADHVWVDATCENPKTCSVCGLTEGEAFGHLWQDANCVAPKTCMNCGKTEGEALGHSWLPADFYIPKRCSICGAMEGEALSCEMYSEADAVPGNHYASGKFEDYMYTVDVLGSRVRFTFYSLDGTERGSIEDWFSFCSWRFMKDGFMFSYQGEDDVTMDMYDTYGNRVYQKVVGLYDYGYYYGIDYGDVYPDATVDIESGLVRVYCVGSNETVFYYDPQTQSEVSEDVYYQSVKKVADTDSSLWSYCEAEPIIDGYFVKTLDESQWGFIDPSGNTLGMYMDATNFNAKGYALVSMDRVHYSLIDTTFTIVAEDIIDAAGAFYVSDGSDAFCTYDTYGNLTYYVIG